MSGSLHRSLISKMADEDGSQVTDKIWSLTLEILAVLTGETFSPGDHVTIAVSPPPSLTCDRITMQKLLDVTNKMTGLISVEIEASYEMQIKEESEDEPMEGYSEDWCQDRKMASSEILTMRRGGGASAEDRGVATDVRIVQAEESWHVIDSDGRYTLRNAATQSEITRNIKTEDKNYAPGIPVTSEFPPDPHSAEALSDHTESSGSIPSDSHQRDGVICLIINPTEVKPSSSPQPAKRSVTKFAVVDNEVVQIEEKRFACSECSACFSTKPGLLSHERAHKGVKSFSCPECGKDFYKKTSLIKHQIYHTGQKPFPCTQCGKGYHIKSDLAKHEKVHITEKPFLCPDCGKCFVSNSDLMKHQRVHTQEKPYPCPDCGKNFSSKSSLTSHIRLHTGEKPFICSECGKCFADRSNLQKHKRFHAGKKPYACTDCGKSFSQNSDLAKHKRIHNGEKPYICFQCGKCFATKQPLMVHERIHTGEKPYSCQECGKSFPQKSNLISHRRFHTGEKPFSCEECGKCFTSLAGLLKHEKLHEGGDSTLLSPLWGSEPVV